MATDWVARPRRVGRAVLDMLCRPSLAPQSLGASAAALAFPMWSAITLAMMLPTAAGMIGAYAQIADTAAHKGEPAIAPLGSPAAMSACGSAFALIATMPQVMPA